MFAGLPAPGVTRYRGSTTVNFTTGKGRNDMSHLVRITALVAALVAAGCVSNAEVAQTSPVVATESLWSEMHAAIPASRTNDNVFEYN